MSFTVQDVVSTLGDNLGNYSTGQASNDQKIRAINSAINYLKLRIGIPQDEKIYSFYYTSDNLYWAVPSDFEEAIGLYFNNKLLNNPNLGQGFEYRPWRELLGRSGIAPTKREFGHTTINGSHQLIITSSNTTTGQMLQNFDTTKWTASGDASAAATDTNIFYEGIASESFTLGYSSGQGILTSPTVFWDFTALINKSGFLNLFAYFPSTAVTSVALRYGTDQSNYYTITVTQNADSLAWQLNQWNKLLFKTQNAVITGSPTKSNITFFKLIFNIPNTFGTVTNFRVDDFYTTYPDYLDFVYYSKNKGTDTTGVTSKTKLTLLSDIITYDDDYLEVIALRAALYLWPQLKGDINFMQMYKADFEDQIRLYGRRWPRKRGENNFGRTVLRR